MSLDAWKYGDVKTDSTASRKTTSLQRLPSASSDSEDDYKRKFKERRIKRQEETHVEMMEEIRRREEAREKKIKRRERDVEPDYATQLRRR